MKKRPRLALRVSTLSILFLTLVFELLFGYWLQHPSKIPSSLLSSFRQYYVINYRTVIQVESNCSEYDLQFFYRLRPSVQCLFEYRILFPIETNSAGLRDDENSLLHLI
jgi:hypothetical protein